MSLIPPLETVEFQIGKWAMDFLRDYLVYLGSEKDVESVCRDMVFDGIIRLRDRVKALPYFAHKFYDKYENLSILECLDPPEDLEEKIVGC